MKLLYTRYNMYLNSIDITTFNDYILRIDCNKAREVLKTTAWTDHVLNAYYLFNSTILKAKRETRYSFILILSIPKILREEIYIKLFSICVHPDSFNGVLITFIFSNVSLFQKEISEQG